MQIKKNAKLIFLFLTNVVCTGWENQTETKVVWPLDNIRVRTIGCLEGIWGGQNNMDTQ